MGEPGAADSSLVHAREAAPSPALPAMLSALSLSPHPKTLSTLPTPNPSGLVPSGS